jgi:hypothetical protein
MQKGTSLPPQSNLNTPLTVATSQLLTHYEELLNDCAFRATACITVHSRTGHIVAFVIGGSKHYGELLNVFSLSALATQEWRCLDPVMVSIPPLRQYLHLPVGWPYITESY